MGGKSHERPDVQVLDDPLHDAKVVHHLHEGDEEYNCTQNTGKEPVFRNNGVFIKEENGADLRLLQEIGGEESEPPENLEASIGLEDKQSNGLLEEKANDDSLPNEWFQGKIRHRR